MNQIIIDHEKLSNSDTNNLINILSYKYSDTKETFVVSKSKYQTFIELSENEETIPNIHKVLSFYRHLISVIRIYTSKGLIVFTGNIYDHIEKEEVWQT
jgi:hypothetical protein